MATSYRTVEKPGYIPFDANKLIVGTKIFFDVYTKQGGIYQALFESGLEFTAITRNFLIGRSLNTLYISDSDKPSLDTYLSQAITEVPSIRESPKAFKDYSFHKEQYYQIDRQMLIPGTEVHFNIYKMKDFSYTLALSAKPDARAVVDEDLPATKCDLMILQSDIPKYNEYLNSLLKSDKALGKDSGKMKALAIRENSKIIIRDLFENPRSGEAIKETQVMVHVMIESIMQNRDTIYDLLSIRGYDYYTYTHSVNVCVLSVGLGVALKLDPLQSERLGLGAMVHDIGKSIIPVEILNKQGKLDDMEYRIMQSHVAEGEKLLRENHHLPEEAILAVTQHHEKISGRGYPSRLSDKAISLFGRITAIADCYDALTTARPYKTAFTPFVALDIISKEGDNYDRELLRLFITMLGKIK